MGIQAWFIILGVGAMTLIVWDGKRSKLKQRASSVAVGAHQAPTASSSHRSDEPLETMAPPTVDAVTEVDAAPARIYEGSRIGAATHISGRVIADEPVLIKGHVEGAVIAPNHLVSVAATGHIASYIEGSHVDIDGDVMGTLKANTKATLLSRARIQGMVEAPQLECVAGAWLQVDVAQKPSRHNVALMS